MNRLFLRGPVPWWWLVAAASHRGRALAVGLACWLQAGLRGSKTNLPLNLSRIGVPRSSAGRGLARLERAGLVLVDRHRGRMPRVTIVVASVPTPKP